MTVAGEAFLCELYLSGSPQPLMPLSPSVAQEHPLAHIFLMRAQKARCPAGDTQ